MVRFRDKVYQLVASRGAGDEMDDETLRLMHKTIKKVGFGCCLLWMLLDRHTTAAPVASLRS